MEPQFFAFKFASFFLPLFLLISFVLVLSNTGWKKSRQKAKQKLPPGPWKLPIFGSIHQLAGSLPHRVLRDLASKHGPLMHLKLGELSVIVVSSPLLAKEITKTHDLAFASRPGSLAFEIACYNYSDIGFCPYGEYWRQMRKIAVLELLSAKSVRSFGPIRLDEGSRLVASVKASAGKQINLSKKIIMYTSSVICRVAFGKVCRDQVRATQLVKQVEILAATFGLAEIFPSSRILQILCGSKSKLSKVHHELDKFWNEIIDEHVKNLETTKKGNGEFGEEDLTDILLKIKRNGDLQFPLTNNNIKGFLFDIFAGGADTSSTVVDWAMSELIRKPHLMAKAQREIRVALRGKTIDETNIQGLWYLKLVIKETLRLHPPAPLLLPRECREDCQIDGYHIPKKTRVIINAWALGRHEKYWSDPESFNPERFENNPLDFSGNDYEFIPFGSGRRMCPGMAFGLANVELPLALLLYHFNWKVPEGLNPQDLDMSETNGLVCSRKSDLQLIPTSYDPSLDMPC